MKIILFDGICNFCNSIVNLVLKHDKENIFLFSAQQSVEGQRILARFGKQEQDVNSLIFIDENEVFEGADAAIQISKYLRGFPRILYSFRIFPRTVNHTAYNFIAKNRYKIFGKRNECRVPTEKEKKRFL